MVVRVKTKIRKRIPMQDILKSLQVKKGEAAAHIANLKNKLKETEAQAKEMNSQKREIEHKIAEWKRKIEKAESDILKLKKKSEGVIVSEHAIVRYFERVLGYDLDKIKSEILGGADPKSLIKYLEKGVYPVNNTCTNASHRCIIHQGVVTTVLTQDGQNH